MACTEYSAYLCHTTKESLCLLTNSSPLQRPSADYTQCHWYSNLLSRPLPCLWIIFYRKDSYDFLKWSLLRDFRLQIFFINLCPPGPSVSHWDRFEFFRKFAEIIANECLSAVSIYRHLYLSQKYKNSDLTEFLQHNHLEIKYSFKKFETLLP